MKIAMFIICAVLGLAANALIACGIKYPSCGSWRQRLSDGATCRECVDKVGPYAECGMKVLEKK